MRRLFSKKSPRFASKGALATGLGGLLLAELALAQGPLPPSFPTDAEASDVDEVEEVVPDSEVLLPSEDASSPESQAPQDPQAPSRLGNISKAHAEELRYTQEETRSRFSYGLALAVGTAMPWQSYTLSAYRLLGGNWAVGLYVGAGRFTDTGTLDDQAFDLKVDTRSSGVDGRYYFSTLERLSLQAALGYAVWDGNVSPNSSDDADVDSEEKLATSYDATGVVAGFAVLVTWLWDSGFYIDWTPVGMRKAWISSLYTARDSAMANELLSEKIEAPFFYGITNLRFGYLF